MFSVLYKLEVCSSLIYITLDRTRCKTQSSKFCTIVYLENRQDKSLHSNSNYLTPDRPYPAIWKQVFFFTLLLSLIVFTSVEICPVCLFHFPLIFRRFFPSFYYGLVKYTDLIYGWKVCILYLWQRDYVYTFFINFRGEKCLLY